MKFIDFFKSKKKNNAQVAKERLQIIVAHRKAQQDNPDYLPKLQKDLVSVISKYVPIDEDMVKVSLDRSDEYAVLELNISLPDEVKEAEPA